MADDYEDTFDLDDLSDQELQELVRSQLDDYDTIDADNILVRVQRGEDQLGGDADMTTDPAALREEEDLEADLYGTHDVQRAIEQGTSYEPPDTPTPESGEDRV
jgi:osmotically-inducible protein OsmY